MSRTFFISDVHLGLETSEREAGKQKRLLSFLDYAGKEGSGLYILGDLFDAWIEYRTVIPKGFHRVLSKLHDLCESGMDIHYLVGNHDFWMRDYFSREMGIKIHIEAFEVELDGKRVYLHHGDGLDPRDYGYRFLSKILRNRLSIWLFSWLHPDIGMTLAKSSSKSSRSYTSGRDCAKRDVMGKQAARLISEGYDFVIMGHRHIPREETIGDGSYVNLGDWISHNTYALLENGTLSVHRWEHD